MTRKLVAAKAFNYARRALEIGDEFDARDADARWLIALGRARAVAPLPEHTRAPRPYETRIMTPGAPGLVLSDSAIVGSRSVHQPDTRNATTLSRSEPSEPSPTAAADALSDPTESADGVVRARRRHRRRESPPEDGEPQGQ